MKTTVVAQRAVGSSTWPVAFIFPYKSETSLSSTVCRQQNLCSSMSMRLDVWSALSSSSSQGHLSLLWVVWDLLTSSALLQWKFVFSVIFSSMIVLWCWNSLKENFCSGNRVSITQPCYDFKMVKDNLKREENSISPFWV